MAIAVVLIGAVESGLIPPASASNSRIWIGGSLGGRQLVVVLIGRSKYCAGR